MSVELMLNAVNLLLTAFSVYRGDASGQVFVFFIMALAAAEVAVGLAIIVMIYRNTNSIDINVLNRLKCRAHPTLPGREGFLKSRVFKKSPLPGEI